ncbi:MAG: hypothetical protein FJ020_04510 [Chloroflexi bacterium]|nr:hypothetical protein [Chloroflexota bacterium]
MKNTMHRAMMAGLLLLLVLTLAPNQWLHQNARAETTQEDGGVMEVDINPNGTYLHAVNWYDQWGPGPSDLTPTIVDLESCGIASGDRVILSISGRWSPCAKWGLPETECGWYDASNVKLLAVFSANSSLGPLTGLHRVPGAIDFGEDYATPPTVPAPPDYDPPLTGGGEPTDIPEDFRISPNEGMSIEIPKNAKFLMFSFAEGIFYAPDNDGNLKVTIDRDSDGDGLLDSWEQDGIDFDKDGEVDLDLPMLGADWEHKDIFLEADYMSGYAPDQLAIDDVKASFANSPVANPDNINGINLHVVVNEVVPWKELLNVWADYYSLKSTYFGKEDERTDINAIQAKKMVFRYCLFVDKMSFDPKCPGVAEGITCDDFVLAFGAFKVGHGGREDQAAVFMHELGHALGLHHGGNTAVNFKPNYLSIMNYAFEFNTWKPTRPLDYSHGSCIDLKEDRLDETQGIGYSEVTVWRAPGGVLCTNSLGLYINWDDDSDVDMGTARVNLNNHPDFPSPDGETLKDYNDWANLVYSFRGTSLSAASATPEDYHVELTVDQIERMREEAKDMVEVSVPELADTGSGLPWAVYAAIGAGVAAIAVAAVLFLRRKRS